MATIARLAVSMSANTTRFMHGMTRARQAVVALGRTMARITAAVAKVGIGFGVVAAAGLAVWLKRTFTSIDATAKLADRLGATTEALIGLQHAASIMGVDAEGLNKALVQFVRRLGEAEWKTGEVRDALDMLALSSHDLSIESPTDAFIKVAGAIAKLETHTQRADAAYRLFGRQGVALANILDLGEKGIRALMDEAEKLGLTFSRIDAAKIEAANDAMTRLHALIRGLVQSLAIGLAPYIEAIAERITKLGTSGTGAAERITAGMRGILKTVAALSDSLDFVIGILHSLRAVAAATMMAIGTAIEVLLTGIAKVVAAFSDTASREMEKFLIELDTFNDALAKTMKDAWAQGKAAGQRWEAGARQKQVEALFVEIAEGAQKAAEAAAQAAQARRDISAGAEEMGDILTHQRAIEGIIERLKEQAATLGLTKAQVTRYTLELHNATQAQLDLSATLLSQVATFDNAAKNVERLRLNQERWLNRTKTPIEEFEENLREIEELFITGKLNAEQYDRALQFSKKRAMADISGAKSLVEGREINLAVQSAAALRLQAGGDPYGKQERKRQLDRLIQLAEDQRREPEGLLG